MATADISQVGRSICVSTDLDRSPEKVAVLQDFLEGNADVWPLTGSSWQPYKRNAEGGNNLNHKGEDKGSPPNDVPQLPAV